MLHKAAGDGNDRVVELLVGQHADMSTRGIFYAPHYLQNNDSTHSDRDGLTALHYAAKAGHLVVVELLVGLGSDCNSKGRD
jgi:ankyrin repeat protein